MCTLQISGRFNGKEFNYHQYASPRYPLPVRKAAIESILRLYLSENGVPEIAEDQDISLSTLHGPAAAYYWVLSFVSVETLPALCSFAVEALLGACRGLPPQMASLALNQTSNPYWSRIQDAMQIHTSSAFVKTSPVECDFEGLFKAADLTYLQGNNSVSRYIVHRIWYLLNGPCAFDQPLRIALMQLYRSTWGENTPACVASSVKVNDKKLGTR